MKVRVGRGAAAFVEKNNCPRFHPPQNPCCDGVNLRAYGIETADRPADQNHSTSLQRRVDKKILQTSGRSKIAANDSGLIDLSRNRRGREAPEYATRVRSSMVGNFVTGGAN